MQKQCPRSTISISAKDFVSMSLGICAARVVCSTGHSQSERRIGTEAGSETNCGTGVTDNEVGHRKRGGPRWWDKVRPRVC